MKRSLKLYLRSIWEIELPPYIYTAVLVGFLSFLLLESDERRRSTFYLAVLVAIIITLIPGIVQKRSYLKLAMKLEDKNLSNEELYRYKKFLLRKPFSEGIFSSVRWTYSMILCSIVGHIIEPHIYLNYLFIISII